MTKQHMSGRHLTQSKYRLQQILVPFGDFLLQLAKAQLTHTYPVACRFCQLKNIEYLLLQ